MLRMSPPWRAYGVKGASPLALLLLKLSHEGERSVARIKCGNGVWVSLESSLSRVKNTFHSAEVLHGKKRVAKI